ncbi:hypothetical protein JHK82_013177 [Glycine max]|nr:hypothetical protein JHK85_013548 [Glycine max]KAG5058210.1 hypothetical protein JHK86_013206 [Glycine max]KAG5155208.1 hypothetical protein JHK82_013177 [Glycine max]KHN06481.1 hypothetical protein glysoja_010825 [Glycine soja]
MPLVVVVVDSATGFGDEVERDKIPVSTCFGKCMNICMKIKFAADSECQKACRMGCKQLQGKGSIFYRPQKDIEKSRQMQYNLSWIISTTEVSNSQLYEAEVHNFWDDLIGQTFY